MWVRLVALAGSLALVLAACGGDDEDGLPPLEERGGSQMELSSPDVEEGGDIPVEVSCDGAGRLPVLAWENVPGGTAELALVVEDPDAPDGTFTHAVAWGIDPEAGRLEDPGGLSFAVNDAGEAAWTPPCPPEGDAPHRYVFTLYALSGSPEAEPGASHEEAKDALAAVQTASATLIGLYGR